MFNPEFDCPFTVTDDGKIIQSTGEHAPEVYVGDTPDVDIEIHGDWSALVGYTGQYSYNGAVMHQSEQFSGRLYSDVMEQPGTYVIVEVKDFDDPEALVGWAVLRKND